MGAVRCAVGGAGDGASGRVLGGMHFGVLLEGLVTLHLCEIDGRVLRGMQLGVLVRVLFVCAGGAAVVTGVAWCAQGAALVAGGACSTMQSECCCNFSCYLGSMFFDGESKFLHLEGGVHSDPGFSAVDTDGAIDAFAVLNRAAPGTYLVR